MQIRCGTGFDVHKLVKGRRLVLGGVTIAHEKGLLGHSDADVLSHAIGDALLGAAALGDLGTHFPDTSDRWKDACSLDILGQIKDLVLAEKWQIQFIDSIIIAQSPKMAPHIPEMRRNISGCLDINQDQVSVKATTTEGLGFTGKGEGMAAQAVVTLFTP